MSAIRVYAGDLLAGLHNAEPRPGVVTLVKPTGKHVCRVMTVEERDLEPLTWRFVTASRLVRIAALPAADEVKFGPVITNALICYYLASSATGVLYLYHRIADYAKARRTNGGRWATEMPLVLADVFIEVKDLDHQPREMEFTPAAPPYPYPDGCGSDTD